MGNSNLKAGAWKHCRWIVCPKATVAALELVVVTGAIVHTGCAALDASDKEKNAKTKKKGEGDCQNRTSDLPGCNGLLYL